MTDTITSAGHASVEAIERVRVHNARRLGVIIAVASIIVVWFAANRTPQPAIALLLFGSAIVAAAVRPILGVFAIVFFTLVGDSVTAPWYPVAKNLSSVESWLYLADRVTVTPLEVLTAATFVFWMIDVLFDTTKRVITTQLTVAVAIFTGFVAFGFARGVTTGGDLRIALFEGRAMFIVLPLYILITNVCDRTELRRLMWAAVVAILANALLALHYLSELSPAERDVQEDLGEHGASVHINFLILLTVTLFLYRGGSRLSRCILAITCVPATVVYFTAERRSAVVALGVGLGLVVASLWWRHPRKFLVIAPVALLVTVGYSAAFWNSTTSLGFPAQAVKTVVDPDGVTEKDRSSDLYRDIENFDINYTIRSAPVLGLGFGQKFLRPIPLPDISFFEFYEYIPHNSVLWIWIKTGFFGFVAMLVMFAIAIRDGARRLVTSRDPTMAAMAMIGVVNVAMFLTYAFVDIAWDPRAMVMLALSFALCSSAVVRPAPDSS